MAFLELTCIFFVLIIVFRTYIKWLQKYWIRRNVPSIQPTSIWGNMESPFNTKHGIKYVIKNGYHELKSRGEKHGGIYLFMQPVYIAVDPELIKHIVNKDFEHFTGRGVPINEKHDPLTAHIGNLDGGRWKSMRVKVTPAFTSGKMKMMFNTLLECGAPMLEYVGNISKTKESMDIKEVLGCYTTDVIGSCAFGLECNSFKDGDAEFRTYGRKIFIPRLRTLLVQLMLFVVPSLAKVIRFRIVPKDVETFFMNVIRNVIDYRTSKNVKRNDFIQLFIEMQEKAIKEGEKILTLEQIGAQAFAFFAAGFETSSTAMTFSMHELAFNQDIQDKLREEIRETMKQYDGKLTYEGVMGMKYLDQVVNETLRKYPPVPILIRKCNKNYDVPNTDVTIEKGTTVFISSLGLHMDEEYYPDPRKFNPERFDSENKAKRPPYTFLPFGEGPRICIGLRFGLMQTKTGLCMILNNYRILPGEGESYNIEMDPKSMILTKKGTLKLKVEKL